AVGLDRQLPKLGRQPISRQAPGLGERHALRPSCIGGKRPEFFQFLDRASGIKTHRLSPWSARSVSPIEPAAVFSIARMKSGRPPLRKKITIALRICPSWRIRKGMLSPSTFAKYWALAGWPARTADSPGRITVSVGPARRVRP